MSEYSPRDDYRPLTWIGRVPVYTAGVIAALILAGMFATVFLQTARANIFAFLFSPEAFWHGSVWQVLTYWMVNEPSFFFLFSLFFFTWFGTDVERYLGRLRFFRLLAIALLVPVLMTTLWWLCGYDGAMLGGTKMLSISLFVAFATLYPNLEYWGWITMKWLVFAGIVLESMEFLPRHDWPGLASLLAVCAASFGYIKFLQLRADFSIVTGVFKKAFGKKPKFKVVPRESPRRDEKREEVHESIDPLLDKISKSGIQSLSAKERALLEKLSAQMKKKD